jgi:acyl-CoA synthetase (AMP-forming)/AMP-acid ligase II
VAIHRSPYPDVEVPDIPLTPFVLGRAGELSDRAALIDGPSGRVLTYGALAAQVRALAAGLAGRGFGKGDVFAIYLPNVPEYAVAFHGVISTGGAVTTINPLYTVDELADQLKISGARYLLTIGPFLDTALEAAARAGVGEVFVLGDGDGASPFASLFDSSGDWPAVSIDPARDLVALPCSSGTTGLCKSVMLSHRNLVANVLQSEAAHPIGGEDRLMGVLPFFHIYGQTVIMNMGLHLGATIVTMPRFDLEQFLGLIQEHRLTFAHLVPPIVLALAKHPLVDRYDLSSLHTVLSGAAPLGAELERACAKRIGVAIIQGYGMTEASPVTHVRPLDDTSHPGSIGPTLPSTESRIVTPDGGGQDAPPGENGEIWIRGPQVMQGYLNDPEATARTLDAEGWLHTGDIGHVDQDGFFYVVDRLKELIKYKGYQVPPAELEAILVTHPAVADAAVTPHPDEEAGEIPKAFVVLKPDADASPEDIMAFVAERVSPQKRVRLVEFISEIPKSASGKILRRVLVDRERAGASG